MKKAENTGNYIDISFSNKRNNVFLLLLYKSYYLNLVTFAVAPLAGAWVEIAKFKRKSKYDTSLPSRERGLKSVRQPFRELLQRSLPSRERGLKLWIWMQNL